MNNFFSELEKIRDFTYNDPKDELISKLKREIRQLKLQILLNKIKENENKSPKN